MPAWLETPTFKALSALLTYPTEDLVAAVDEIEAALVADGLVSEEARAGLARLFDDLRTQDIYDLQEHYVGLFDKTRNLSLHLFEHVHGESRDRGQAMVDLADHYAAGGLELTAHELPDFLPLFLEFLATRPRAEAVALLADTDPILSGLEERLAKRGEPHAAVFAAIRSLVGTVDGRSDRASVGESEAGGELETLDAAWEETAVTFGPGDGLDGCSVDRLKTRMRAARRDARTISA